MRKISRKILGYLLSVAMVMSSLSLPAFASEIDEDTTAIEEAVEAELENEFVSEEVVDDTDEDIISDGTDEETSGEIISDDVVDVETEDENILSETGDRYVSYYFNGVNQEKSGLEFAIGEVNSDWKIIDPEVDLHFNIPNYDFNNNEIYKFYYTVGDSKEEKNLKDTPAATIYGLYSIPAEDIKNGDITIFLVVRGNNLGKISFTMDEKNSNDLEFQDGIVYEDWCLYENAGDIKFKLVANLLGKEVKSFTYEVAGSTEGPVSFDERDSEGYYTISREIYNGNDVSIVLVTEDLSGSLCEIKFVNDGEEDTKNLIFASANVNDSWGVESADDIVFSIAEEAFKERCVVKTVTYKVGDGEQIEIFDNEGVYTIPAKAITGEDIVIELTTEYIPELNKFSLKDVGNDNVITLEAGTLMFYKFEKKPEESRDEVGVILSEDATGFDAYFHFDLFCVSIHDVLAEEVKGSFSFVNKSVVDENGKNPVLSTYTVKAKNPAWTEKKVSAEIDSTTDVSINVRIKPFTVLENKMTYGDFYYKVELMGTPDLSNTGLEINQETAVQYVNTDDEDKIVTIKPFLKGSVPAELGEGIAANFKVEVSVVQKKKEVLDTPKSDEDTFLSSQKLVLSTATKAPHYAEKISIKNGKTTLYAGEGYYTDEVKIGTVTFGKNDTFVTNQNWTIRTLIAPNGESLGSVSEPYSEEGDSLYGVKLYNSTTWNDYEDNGIYASVSDCAMVGKYTAIVATNDGNGQTPEAKITFTVNACIQELDIAGPNKIYKNGNKKVTAKTTTTAYSEYFDKKDGYFEGNLKNPKVSYKVGVFNSMSYDIDVVEGITIDKKGVITIDKKFKVTDENKDTVYSVMVNANDYVGNPVNPCRYSFTIVNEATKVKSLELYLDNGESATGERYSKLNSKSSVPYDLVDNICFAVKGTDGKYIAGGNGKEGNNAPVFPNDDIKYNSYGKSGLMITTNISDVDFIYKPTNMTFTLKSVNGSKASASVNLSYGTYSNDYNDLIIENYDFEEVDKSVYVFKGENDDSNTYEIPESWGNNPLLIISIGCFSDFYSDIDYSINEHCVSGSLSVSGAKVLYDYGKYYEDMYNYVASAPRKQSIIIQPTKPEVKVIMTKQVYDNGKLKTVKKQYVLKCKTLDKQNAPKVKSCKITMPDGKGGYTYEKITRNRIINSEDALEFKLDKPLTLPQGVAPEDVQVVMSSFIKDAGFEYIYLLKNEDTNDSGVKFQYCVDEGGKNPCIRVYNNGGYNYLTYFLSLNNFNVSFKYYYLNDLTPNDTEDDSFERVYLTKTTSNYKTKLAKYEKSFKTNSSQTLKFSAASGDTPATVTSDFIKGKGKNVKRVVLLNVSNCNVKGKYNDFDQFFEVKDGKLSVKESKLEVLNAEALKAKKKVPASKTGYVNYLVIYTDGSTQEMVSKVTVKFSK
ncbi:MAG: hypothetical protein MJ119_03065 [Lachnospiraceae bacterium]|nr:hypothetical protein [Lachnospiraceae bacterium]